MAKTRLTGERRAAIRTYMESRFYERQDRTLEGNAFKTLLALVNSTIRQKFPEKDMVVLRRYKLTHVDRCLRFHQSSSGRVVGITFDYGTEGIADMPSLRGCRSSDVFPASDDLMNAFETWQAEKTVNDDERTKKRREYAAFIEAAKTVEDIEDVVPLPPDLRLKLTGSNTAIVAVSDEIVADLRAEFAEVA